uniref:Uncharacterized protein n=1 Tax=Anopheles minimus TaxID=112268 RepID=A0A182WFZ5_9DIPT
MFARTERFLPGIMGMGIVVGGVRNLDSWRVGQRLGGGMDSRGSMSIGLVDGRSSIGLVDGRSGVGGVDGRSGMSVSHCWGSMRVASVDGRGGIGGVDSWGSIGNLLGQDGLVSIGQLGQLVGDAGVRLADARVRSVDSLGVVRDGAVVRADGALMSGSYGRAGQVSLGNWGSIHLRSGIDLRGGVRQSLGDWGSIGQLGRGSLRDGAVAHRRSRRVVSDRSGVLDGMASLQVSSASDGQRGQENDEL